MFSPNFNITPRITQLLLEIERHKESLMYLPVNASLIASLRESARLITTHYSTQIEGNRLTMEQVSKVVIDGKSGFPGRERDEKEVKNYFLALEFVEREAQKQASLTEDLIKRIHGLNFYGKNKPTNYRNGQNVIRDSSNGAIIYLPPEAHDVPAFMKNLLEWISIQVTENILPVPLIAAIAHYQFATIHPYYDGNGRTAQLLTTFILHVCGYGLKGIYSLEEYYAKNLTGYYRALTVGPSHNYYGGRAEADITPFIEYFCDGMSMAFASVREQASQNQGFTRQDHSGLLRTLSPQQKAVLSLFKEQMIATSAEIGAHLGMSKRSASELATKWVNSDFFQIANASKKGRSYSLTETWEAYLNNF